MPLVLIQGLGYTADLWFRVLPGLSGPRRTIRFDNRGVGRSSVPPTAVVDRGDGRDAVNVLDAAGIERAHVFGVSMGGLIAQELALRHPDRVAALVLGCTHPGGRDAVRMDPAAATMLMDRTPKSAREAIEASVPFLYAETTTRDDIEGDISARVRYALRATSYWGQLDAMRQHDGTLSRLPRDHGADAGDPRHGRQARAAGQRRADRRSDPRCAAGVAEGAGHVFWTDQPRPDRRAGERVPGRGSAAGCQAAWTAASSSGSGGLVMHLTVRQHAASARSP